MNENYPAVALTMPLPVLSNLASGYLQSSYGFDVLRLPYEALRLLADSQESENLRISLRYSVARHIDRVLGGPDASANGAAAPDGDGGDGRWHFARGGQTMSLGLPPHLTAAVRALCSADGCEWAAAPDADDLERAALAGRLLELGVVEA